MLPRTTTSQLISKDSLKKILDTFAVSLRSCRVICHFDQELCKHFSTLLMAAHEIFEQNLIIQNLLRHCQWLLESNS